MTDFTVFRLIHHWFCLLKVLEIGSVVKVASLELDFMPVKEYILKGRKDCSVKETTAVFPLF